MPVNKSYSPLKNWILDNQFIESVMSLSQTDTVFSFDIFDTALTRTVESPVDVFAEVERRLILIYGKKARGFAEAREVAEQKARINQYQTQRIEEINFQEIYNELPQLLPHFNAWHHASELEFEVENEVLHASPDILELTQRLIAHGKRVIFVSDMYLPSDFLANVLAQQGYKEWNSLFVSSELRATKASGAIWKLLPTEYTGDMVHIGDDENADIETPKAFGIKTVPYIRLRSQRRIVRSLNPPILPFSYAQRHAGLMRRKDTKEATHTDYWRDIGRTFGGIVVGSFLKWLHEQVVTHHIEKLYFCSRDGWLMKRAWEASGLDFKTGLNAHYFYISRRPLNLARGFKESSPHRLSESLLDFLCSSDGFMTLSCALERANLNTIPSIYEDALKAFGSLDAKIDHPNGVEKFRELLQRHASEVIHSLEIEYNNLVQYLHQEDFFTSKRVAIIDMGWHVTMQRSLSFIRKIEQNCSPVTGFYYGLWAGALGNRYEAGLVDAAFASDFLSIEEQPEVHGVVEILEELHSAPHGTVHGYDKSNGHWNAVLSDSPIEIQQYKNHTQYFQDGVLETVSNLFNGKEFLSLKFEDLSKENAIAAMGAIALAPTQQEVELFSQINHCSSFDHSSFTPLASSAMPLEPDRIHREFFQTGWRVGTLKNWLRNATEEQKIQIKQIADNHLAYLGSRTLRQFS